MKKLIFILTVMITAAAATAQLQPIKLNAPNLNRGLPVMQAFKERHSERAYADKPLSLQDLSDLLWAATGVNRPDGHLTAPTALNKRDIDVYALTAEGAYRYDAQSHTLVPVEGSEGDHRALIRGFQTDFQLPPVTLIMVTTPSRFGVDDAKAAMIMGAADAGIVSENISLFCAGNGLVTVPRASMNQAELRELLRLPDNAYFILNNPVGYPVK